MILRTLAASLCLMLAARRRRAAAPRDPAFEKFLAELWTDAQAKGITRATFDKAFAASRPTRA